LKILCTADVHIGRRSTRLPSSLDAHQHSSAAAWSRIVDLAVREQVDLVAVSGDLVDQANRYFEAFGALERGLQRLSAAGITAILVAGNHDHDVLPLLVDGMASDRVRLLGRGGVWERETVAGPAGPLHVDGWSFPRAEHASSPLATYRPQIDGSPVLTLLHGDLDQSTSRYAPISSADLRRYPGVFFHLGHVHSPRLVDEPGGARALYPGSPQALDPGEPGMHGVALLTLRGSRFEVAPVPLSTVRYEPLDVDLGSIERAEEVAPAIALAARARLQAVAEGTGELRHLVLRPRLFGPSALHARLDARLLERTAAELELEHGGVTATLDGLILDTTPGVDLAELGRGHGPPAVLARLVARLDRGEIGPEEERLLGDAARAARRIDAALPYVDLQVGSGDRGRPREEVLLEVRRSAMVLIGELLAQKEIA
jgi:DNA repair protein SbcD/Mre11